MSPAVALLGRAALLPSPPRLLRDDPELCGGEAPDGLRVRSLSGQLDTAPDGMSRWKRLDRYGQALAVVCDRAIDRDTVSGGPPTGLYVASLRSCFETNTAFDRGLIEKDPRLASPLLFPHTLPGATASEVAMLLGLLGPYLVFPGDAAAALAALLTAIDAIEAGEANRLLVATADVLGPETIEWLTEHDELRDARAPPLSEAAAALWIGRADDPATGARRTIEGALGPAQPSAEQYERLIREALERARIGAGEIRETVSTTLTADDHAALSEAMGRSAPESEILQIAWTAGDAGASTGLLAVQAALDEEEPRLVLAGGNAGSVALVVV
ncbi:MAG: beta-ketoacyl synthase N-terminal-like domain-containing protein [Myxococcota bacterium]